MYLQWTGPRCLEPQAQRSSEYTPTCVRTLDYFVCFPALLLKLYVAIAKNFSFFLEWKIYVDIAKYFSLF